MENNMESCNKKANFQKIAIARMNKVIKLLSSMRNLDNSSYYEYTPEEAEVVLSRMEKELAELRELLIENKKRAFKLNAIGKQSATAMHK